LEFWNSNSAKLLILSEIAKSIFSIPATNADSESNFKALPLIITKQKNKYKEEFVQKMLFLYLNYHN